MANCLLCGGGTGERVPGGKSSYPQSVATSERRRFTGSGLRRTKAPSRPPPSRALVFGLRLPEFRLREQVGSVLDRGRAGVQVLHFHPRAFELAHHLDGAVVLPEAVDVIDIAGVDDAVIRRERESASSTESEQMVSLVSSQACLRYASMPLKLSL